MSVEFREGSATFLTACQIHSTLKSSVLHHVPPPAPHLTAPPGFCFALNSASSELGHSFQSAIWVFKCQLDARSKEALCSSIKAVSHKTAL